MGEIRFDPLTGEYIIVNDNRMGRPVSTNKTFECPFCANSSRRHPGLPMAYEAISVENLYPSLTLQACLLSNYEFTNDPIFMDVTHPNIGLCEVLLYSSDHTLEFYDQSKELTTKIMQLWKNRVKEIEKQPMIKYIFIFENRGSAAGVSIPHPHGQLYALPFIPPVIRTILKRFKKYSKKYNSCLMCKIFEREKEEKIRIVEKNDFFIAFVPFSAKMLYEIQIVPLNHHKSIAECSLEELESFGSIIQKIRKRYDLLFEIKKASFMMMLFNAPVFKPGKEFIFHYYLQFVCLDRDEKNYKYRASVETGLHIWTNDSSPESIAEQFKNL